MAVSTEDQMTILERRLAGAIVERNVLGTHLLGMCGVVGALLGWLLLNPIAAVLGALAGAIYGYYVYIVCYLEI